MADIPKDVQVFVVQQIACFRTNNQIIDAVKENFDGLVIEKQQIYYYTQQMRKSEKEKRNKTTIELQNIFKAERDKFLKDSSAVAVSHLNYRLSIYNDLIQKEIDKKDAVRNDVKIQSLLEQVAKEVGGMFTNRRELTGAGGKDLMPEQMANVVFKSLISAGWDPQNAADFCAERYQVDKEKVKDNG